MIRSSAGPEERWETWELRVRDRPGALERVLSILRRRLVHLETLSMNREGPDTLRIELRVGGRPDLRDRVRQELLGLVDVQGSTDGEGRMTPTANGRGTYNSE